MQVGGGAGKPQPDSRRTVEKHSIVSYYKFWVWDYISWGLFNSTTTALKTPDYQWLSEFVTQY
jgi:hypothetical protein